jgi:hypothetical protein
VFSTNKDGMNLEFMLQKASEVMPTLLVIQTTEGAVFGGFASEAWHGTHGRYYGTGQSFLFTFQAPGSGFSSYNWTGINSYFQLAGPDFVGMGGGSGGFGLRLDDDFQCTSAGCATFGNVPLAGEGTGRDAHPCACVELWSFTETGRYL